MLSWEQAKRLVQDVEDAFGAADLERIAQGFTEDAVARFADFPEMRGRPAIMSFLGARFARTRGYRLKKKLHVLMDDWLANTWDASWEDARTGRPMLGRGTGHYPLAPTALPLHASNPQRYPRFASARRCGRLSTVISKASIRLSTH